MKAIIVLFTILGTMNLSGQKIKCIKNGEATLSLKIYSDHHLETIILLHGGPGVPDEMLEIVEQLKKDYQVITFEQRGVGLSSCKGCSYRMEDYISDLDVIDRELNLDGFHLFGHSWGGLYAQIYADARPKKVKSLFLCSPSSGTNNTWKETEKEVMRFNKNNSTSKEWMKMGWYSLLGMFGRDKAYQKLFAIVIKNYHQEYAQVDITDEFLNKIHTQPVNSTRKELMKYKKMQVFNDPDFPIMITYGDNDIYGESKKELIARFPHAKVEIIASCGHIPWRHTSVEFAVLLQGFYM